MARAQGATKVLVDEAIAIQAAQQQTPNRTRKTSVQFWIPRSGDDDIRALKFRRPNDWWDIGIWGVDIVNLRGAHRVTTEVGEVQFHGGFLETDNPHIVRALLKDVVAKCRHADIVAAGIFTLPQMQEMGYCKEQHEIDAVVKMCAEVGADPYSQSDKAKKMSESVALRPLPDFDRMTEQAIINWATDDSADGRVLRGSAIIALPSGLPQVALVKRIKAELLLRGDPRVS